MKALIFQKGWNYSQDGPGNRLVYHLQGCNMTCPWCCNPEGLILGGSLIANKKKLLEKVCSFGAIKNHRLNRTICNECIPKKCISKYKNEGIRKSSDCYSIADLVSEVKKARHLFGDEGGVTLTGGEPTLQFDFVMEFFKQLKKEKIRTCLETNATHPFLCKLFPFIDTLIIDLKHYDDIIHKKTLGITNKIIFFNIISAAREGKKPLIRIPLIPHFNDSKKDVLGFVLFLKKLKKKSFNVEFLKFHEYGRKKWEECGLKYRMPNCKLKPSVIKEFTRVFRKNGIEVINT